MIVLSAGHTPRRPGAISGDLKEHLLNVRCMQALAVELLSQGFSVVTLDPLMSLEQKIQLCQREYSRALCIDIHHNAFNSRAEGAEVFYKVGDKRSFDLGSYLLRDTCETLGLRCRGMKLSTQSARGSLGWLRIPHSLLWEICFMDNPQDLLKAPPDLWSRAVSTALQKYPGNLDWLRTTDPK
jgi:N-acetylmuramoyl-L-alanine amidase